MDESRKKLIYLVAGMFLVRRLAGLDRRPAPATENAFRDSSDNGGWLSLSGHRNRRLWF